MIVLHFSCLLAIFYCWFGMDKASGYGIVCKCLHNRRVKKLNDDLVRVRELQGQLGVLRTVRAKRQQEAAKKKEKECKRNAEEPTKRATKGRFRLLEI